MKITVAFLLVAVSCYFNVASANCMARCAQSCWLPHANDMNCLTVALVRNPTATISTMGKFLCAYDRCKAMKNKMELLKSMVNLRVVTQCPLLNLLGQFTYADLNANVDVIVRYLLKAVVDLMIGLNVGSLNTPCGQMGPLLKKTSKTLQILGVPKLDGRIQNIAGINGGIDLFGTVAIESPELVPNLLHLLLGGPGCIVGGGTGLLAGLTGGSSETAGRGSGLLGGSTGVFSETDRGLLSRNGAVPEMISGIAEADTQPNMLGDIIDSAGELTTNTLRDVTEDISEITGDVFKRVEGAVSEVSDVIGRTGLLSGLSGANKAGIYKTESLVNENSYGNGGIPIGRNVGGAMSVGVDGRYSANSGKQGKDVLPPQQNTYTTEGGLAKTVGGVVNGVLGSKLLRK